MTTNTGGPAFPVPDIDGSAVAEGMTLRDYFACRASEKDIEYWIPMGFMVQKVREVANGRKSIYSEPGMYSREQARYRYADAMLKAREA